MQGLTAARTCEYHHLQLDVYTSGPTDTEAVLKSITNHGSHLSRKTPKWSTMLSGAHLMHTEDAHYSRATLLRLEFN